MTPIPCTSSNGGPLPANRVVDGALRPGESPQCPASANAAARARWRGRSSVRPARRWPRRPERELDARSCVPLFLSCWHISRAGILETEGPDWPDSYGCAWLEFIVARDRFSTCARPDLSAGAPHARGAQPPCRWIIAGARPRQQSAKQKKAGQPRRYPFLGPLGGSCWLPPILGNIFVAPLLQTAARNRTAIAVLACSTVRCRAGTPSSRSPSRAPRSPAPSSSSRRRCNTDRQDRLTVHGFHDPHALTSQRYRSRSRCSGTTCQVSAKPPRTR